MPKSKHEKEPLPEPRTLTMPSSEYQPSKAELDAEHDMPGADPETMRRAFFRPYRVKTEEC